MRADKINNCFNSIKSGLIVLAISFCVTTAAHASEYFVDPHFEGEPIGTSTKPFRSIKELFKRVELEGGDTIVLASGFYGQLKIIGRNNTSFVTIKAGDGQTPKFSRVRVQESKNWRLNGLQVSASFDQSYDRSPLVRVTRRSSHIVLEGLEVWSGDDVLNWTAKDWKEKASNGIQADGSDIIIRNNVTRNIRNGISSAIDKGHIDKNLIMNFSGDGILGLGDHTKYTNNIVKNCFDVDDTHHDGFQSWSIGQDGKVGTGEVRGGQISGNHFIYREDANQKYPCSMQGIGMFDGHYVDWRIENNVIVTNHWHGISVYGAKNVLILHNTIHNPEQSDKTWISIGNHKNGTPSENSFILNNIVSRVLGNTTSDVVSEGNIKSEFAEAIFENPSQQNFKLKDGSAFAIDAGVTPSYLATKTNKDMPKLPTIDLAGNTRPQGQWFDVGAYEKTEARAAKQADTSQHER